jgi:hypothetical protein
LNLDDDARAAGQPAVTGTVGGGEQDLACRIIHWQTRRQLDHVHLMKSMAMGVLARALKCHPAVLVFPGWNAEQSAT